MSRRRSTIGANPLDALVPMTANGAVRAEPQAEPVKQAKERATFQLPVGLIERTRNAVYWTPGATMAGIMEEALAAYLGRLEKKRGEPFPERAGALRTGRPVK